MKVVVDTSALNITKAGVSYYISELMDAIRGSVAGITLHEEAYAPLFSRNTPLRVIDSLYRDAVWPTARLPRVARSVSADLIHCPAFLFPLRTRHNILVTVHDLYTYVEPKDFKPWHRSIMQTYIGSAVRQEKHILVLSHFGKQEVLRFFPKANPGRIHVVHSGVPQCRKPAYDLALNKAVLQQYGVDKPYLLSVSTIEPRKNFFRLIKAFASIADKVEHQLLLVGQNGWNNKDVYALIKELRLEQRVRFTGYVPDNVLNNLYTHAACFVFPSLYEGFGFTPLEAMKCGCPVVSSNASCMPEVLGNAAVYFNPTDIDEMAHAIVSVSCNEPLAKQLSVLGITQAAKYNWETTAKRTAGIYQRAVEDSV